MPAHYVPSSPSTSSSILILFFGFALTTTFFFLLDLLGGVGAYDPLAFMVNLRFFTIYKKKIPQDTILKVITYSGKMKKTASCGKMYMHRST